MHNIKNYQILSPLSERIFLKLFLIDNFSSRQVYRKSADNKILWEPLKEKKDSEMVKYVHVGFGKVYGHNVGFI